MEQSPEIRDFLKRYPDKKKGMGKVGAVVEPSSSSGMYLSSSDSIALPSSGTKNPLPQTQNNKWHLGTPELKERIAHKNIQLTHNDSHYVDKLIKNRSAEGGLKTVCSDDHDMFPPLSTHTKMFRAEKNAVKTNQSITQVQGKKTSWKEEFKDSGRRTTQQQENRINFEISQLERNTEWKALNFGSVGREKAVPVEAGEGGETLTSLHGRREANVQLKGNAQNKGADECVKTSSINVSMGELSLRQKTDKQESGRDAALIGRQDIRFMPSSDKPPTGHFCKLDKSHIKETANQSVYLSIENNAGSQQEGKDLKGNLSLSGKSCQRNDSLQKFYNLMEFGTDNGDASLGSPHTRSPDEDAAFCSSKYQIISHLKMLLKSLEVHSPPDGAAEPKSVPSQMCAATGEPETVTGDEGVTVKTEGNLSHEDYSVCLEMLNHYLVVSNFPFSVSKETILYHMNKVGPVTYIVMEQNRAHIIFFKAEDAEVAFGMKHTLFGRQLVVCRPKRPLCTLHLSGLTSSTPNNDIIKLVSAYGIIIGFYRPMNKVTGGPMGYCFIKVDKHVAENILKENILTINNVRIFVEVSSQSEVKFSSHTNLVPQHSFVLPPIHVQGSSEQYKLVFTNAPKLASYDLIKEHFQKFGKLQRVYVKDRRGFVVFTSQDSLEQALSSRHIILGTEIKLCRALVP